MFLHDHEVGAGDTLAERLLAVARVIGIMVFGLLPLVFIPYVEAPLGYTKILFATSGVFLMLMFVAFSFLRQGSLRFRLEWPLVLLWVAFLAGTLSALFSGDLFDSFWGTEVSTHSGIFAGVLALTALAWMSLATNKQVVIRLYLLLGCSAILLAIFHIIRILGGTDVLSFGIFGNNVATPFSEWNSLAIYFGLVIMLSLVALEQLVLNNAGRYLFVLAVVLSLFMLVVVNFQAVFIVLGLVSLVLIIYGLTKGRFRKDLLLPRTQASSLSIGASLATLLVCVIFVVGGSAAGAIVSKMTGISYIEVRPSLRATTGIIKQVYKDDAVLGVGPNRFVDAWRAHRDPSINATIFWNTNFQAGFGYIPTMFVTHGIVGALVWIAFLLSFVFVGMRTLLRAVHVDMMWYFIGLSSFVASVYLWGVSLIYVPGAVLLLLAAATTGIFFAARHMMAPEHSKRISFVDNQRAVFITIATTVAVVVVSVGTLYYMGRYYAATALYVDGVQSLTRGEDSVTAIGKISRAFDINRDDVFARQVAFYEQGRLQVKVVEAIQNNTLSETGLAEIQQLIVTSLDAAKKATDIDASEPENWAVLGRVYATAIPLNIDQAYELAKQSLERARELDPQNPARLVALAEIELLKRNIGSARELVNRAIALKSNYTDAMYVLTQVEIADGNVAAAIESTKQTARLDPNNPVRFYQLGVLQYSQQQLSDAQLSFERAVALSPDYSNARYFLAFVYGAQNRIDDARAQLERVRELNPDNVEVQALLQNISASRSLTPPQNTQPLEEKTEGTETQAPVTQGQAPETPLLSPVNTNTVAPTEGE